MNKRLFSKKPLQNARFIVLVVISCVLLLYDNKLDRFCWLRSHVLSIIIIPTDAIVNYPSKIIKTVCNHLVSNNQLLIKNSYLQKEIAELRAKQQILEYVEQENTKLKSILNIAKQQKKKLSAAHITSIFDNHIFINKGRVDNIKIGQPVLDEYGIFGQVIRVEETHSEIMNITDIKSAIPALIVRNGLHVIVAGSKYVNTLEIINIPETYDIQIGDKLVTSDIGKHFPAGYAIGTVKSINKNPNNRFMKVLLQPDAQINSGNYVFTLNNSKTDLH